jgi:ribosomal protein S21
LTYFEMLKKFKRKIHTYVLTCCMCTKSFYEKPTYHLVYVKKTNFDGKKRHCITHVLSFYTDHVQYNFFAKLLRTHMDYEDVHVKFFVLIF